MISSRFMTAQKQGQSPVAALSCAIEDAGDE
jgi:hypothetical protein